MDDVNAGSAGYIQAVIDNLELAASTPAEFRILTVTRAVFDISFQFSFRCVCVCLLLI